MKGVVAHCCPVVVHTILMHNVFPECMCGISRAVCDDRVAQRKGTCSFQEVNNLPVEWVRVKTSRSEERNV